VTYKTAYQLYSSRNFPPLEAQFPMLKEFGYDAIEPWLPAYEADPAAFRRHLDDAGLACFGFHMPLQGLREEPQRFIEIAQILGATWMIPPYVPPEERVATPDFYRRLGEDLAKGAEAAKPHGLKIAWHNHDFEYHPLPDGSRPIEHIFASGGDDVWFEIDFAWVTRAGADPKAELERYAARIAVIQMKDTAPPGTTEEGGWADTGHGIIDWSSLVPLFATTPADHIVAEHDNPSDWQRFARRSLQAMRELGIAR
jgi:sugar phosphate isomerase/epimerase